MVDIIRRHHTFVAICGVLLLGSLAVIGFLSSRSDKIVSSNARPGLSEAAARDGEPGYRPDLAHQDAAEPEAREVVRPPEEIFKDLSVAPQERISSMQNLIKTGSPQAIDAILEVYEREANFPARHLPVKALADTKDPRAVPVLIEAAATDPSVEVRRLAVRGLERFPGHPESTAMLKQAAIEDWDRFVRRNAIVSLVRMFGEELIDFLHTAQIGENDPEVLAVISSSLVKLGR